MQDWIKEWIEEHRREELLALLGAILIGSGVFWMKSERTKETEIQIVGGQEPGSSSQSGELVIDVNGQVVRPGVYKLPVGSRVEEALAAAGGITSDADTNYIEKYLNRAMRLLDGQKIYIPQSGGGPAVAGQENNKSSAENNLVNINKGTQAELEGLPEIGSGRAAKIISNRPYQSILELLSKKIVGQKVYEQIKDQISVW